MRWGKYNINGQSLIELLLGIAIGAILIGGATGALVVTLRSGLQNKSLQTASALVQELLDKATVYGEGNWRNVYNLNKGQPYHLVYSGSTFNEAAGSENISFEGIDYTRYFAVENVQRDSGDNIVSGGGIEDPSTQLITITVSWPFGGESANIIRSQYIVRKRNLVWRSSSPGDGSESAIFDTGVIGGAAFNTIMWQGSGGTVGFRLASDNEGDGPWNYLGPDGNPTIYYQPAGPNVQSRITAADHNNQRYIRYRLYYLFGSPYVGEVILNYSP